MRSKVHIIANIDNSIKASSGIYEVTLFRNFLEWSQNIEENPTIISLLVMTEELVPFTASNMDALFKHLDSSFFTLHDKVIYCVKTDEKRLKVNEYLLANNKNKQVNVVKNEGDFQGILSILNGSGRSANENELHTITYRVRADEYAKSQMAKKYQSSDDDHYSMDDEEFPEDNELTYQEQEIPEAYNQLKLVHVAGETTVRSYFGVVLAQYLSLFGKTLIIEHDMEYHTTTNALSSIGIEFEYVDYSEFNKDAEGALRKIKASNSKLVLIGCTQRHPMLTYDFIMMMCLSQLKGYVEYLIVESELSALSTGTGGIVVMENTVPHILQACASIPNGVDCSKFQYVCVSMLCNGALARPHAMVQDLLSNILGTDISVECYKFDGLVLGRGGLNDLQVLFRGDSGRQVVRLHTYSQS